MQQLSAIPVAGWQEIVNTGFGNRCICGNHFDEGGICNYGHVQDDTYYVPPEDPDPQKTLRPNVATGALVVCEMVNGRYCSICGTVFSADGIICLEGHWRGHLYAT